MSDDLISRSALRARYQEILDRGDMFCEYDIIGMVDNAPPVDVEQIKSELNPTVTCWYDFDRGYEKGYEKAKKELEERPIDERITEIIEELESRKDYGAEYAQAMEDVITILKAKFGIDKEAEKIEVEEPITLTDEQITEMEKSQDE